MSWVPLAIGGWLLVSVAIALVIGLSIRLADRKARDRRAPDGHRPARAAVAAVPPLPRPPGDGADAVTTARSRVARVHLPGPERQPAPGTSERR